MGTRLTRSEMCSRDGSSIPSWIDDPWVGSPQGTVFYYSWIMIDAEINTWKGIKNVMVPWMSPWYPYHGGWKCKDISIRVPSIFLRIKESFFLIFHGSYDWNEDPSISRLKSSEYKASNNAFRTPGAHQTSHQSKAIFTDTGSSV